MNKTAEFQLPTVITTRDTQHHNINIEPSLKGKKKGSVYSLVNVIRLTRLYNLPVTSLTS